MLKKTKKYIYYKVMWNDGDIDMEMFPDDDDNIDLTDLAQVRKYAKTIKHSWIIKVTEEKITKN